MTLAAGREHYLFGGHDSLYARCSGFSRQSLWLGQIGPPPVCKSMSNVNAVGRQFDQFIETTQAEVAATAPAAKEGRKITCMP